jgi:hypothetical protein
MGQQFFDSFHRSGAGFEGLFPESNKNVLLMRPRMENHFCTKDLGGDSLPR